MKNHFTANVHSTEKIGWPGETIAGNFPKQAGVLFEIVFYLAFREQDESNREGCQ